MTLETDDPVARHYTHGGLLAAILEKLTEAGLDTDTLRVEDVAPVDNLHGRGLKATQELIERLSLTKGQTVLDIGSGIGGPARLIAQETGAQVTGIDLTPEFVEVASALSARTGMAEATTFKVASALDLPFEDGAFDAAYTHNVAMSIPDKAKFYGEAARVIKPSGIFVSIDVAEGPGGEVIFPVPWAETPEISHLISPSATREILESSGFDVLEETDETEAHRAFAEEQRAKMGEAGPPLLSPMIVLNRNAEVRLKNAGKNVEEGRTLPVVFVCRKAA